MFDDQSSEFINVDFQNADFTGRNFEGAVFRGCNLQGVNFSEANLKNAQLLYCDIRGVNFATADLDGVSLEGSVYRDTPTVEAELAAEDQRAKKILKEEESLYQRKLREFKELFRK